MSSQLSLGEIANQLGRTFLVVDPTTNLIESVVGNLSTTLVAPVVPPPPGQPLRQFVTAVARQVDPFGPDPWEALHREGRVVIPCIGHQPAWFAFSLGAGFLEIQDITPHLSEAHTDKLTGLSNRRYFDAALPRIINQTRASSERVGAVVIVVDLNGFKPVNDEIGHHYGDQVLVAVARRLEEACGTTALAFRYGGDEFVVAVGGIHHTDANRLAHRVKASINAKPITVMTPQVHTAVDITASVGASWCLARRDSDTPERLFKAADQAMYLDKAIVREARVRGTTLEVDRRNYVHVITV